MLTIGISFLESYLLAHVLDAGSNVTTTRLGIDGLSFVCTKVVSKRCPRVGDIVSDTFCVRSTIVVVKVLVHVEDESSNAAIWVGDLAQSSG